MSEVIGVVRLNKQLARLAKRVGGPGTGRALFEGALVIERGVKRRIKEQGLIDTGNYRGSVEAVKVSNSEANVTSGVVYAAVHEFGHKQQVTARQRRFFWAMHIETGEDMWLAMALSNELNYPARPHWRPTIREDKGKVEDAIAAALRKEIAAAI